jgi:osmoprotectant transport system substrate-binding protein
MNLSRGRVLALLGGTLILPRCAPSNAIRVGSKDFVEDITIAEIYAGALQRAGFTVEKHMDLGSTQIATEALLRDDIDLYPEYTGTGLIDVLHLPPMRDRIALYETVKQQYAKRFALTWLAPSPANDSQGLATTGALARRYALHTLADCARRAPELRLAAIPEFVARPDGLPGLQTFYGGFRFRSVKTYTIGLQYDALVHGDADVATAFTTDSQIATDALVVLRDDKHFWPPYNISPVIRTSALDRHPRIAGVLNRISALLTDGVVRRLNAAVNVQHADPSAAAAAFLKEHVF